MMRSIEEKKYIREGGAKCLHCDSDNLEGGYVNIEDGGSAWATVACNDCLAEWTDIYKLVRIENLKRGGIKEA